MTTRDELVSLITSTAVAALDWHWEGAPSVPSPEATFRHVAEAIADALEPIRADAERLAAVHALFNGGPDTPCRTTWRPGIDPDGIECVEIPMDDLRAALGES